MEEKFWRCPALQGYAKGAGACGLSASSQRQKVGRKRGKKKESLDGPTKEMHDNVSILRVQHTEEMVSLENF